MLSFLFLHNFCLINYTLILFKGKQKTGEQTYNQFLKILISNTHEELWRGRDHTPS